MTTGVVTTRSFLSPQSVGLSRGDGIVTGDIQETGQACVASAALRVGRHCLWP